MTKLRKIVEKRKLRDSDMTRVIILFNNIVLYTRIIDRMKYIILKKDVNELKPKYLARFGQPNFGLEVISLDY